MPRAMLEYTKTVLQKVSFDAKLFARELQKAITRLLPNEVEELKIWFAILYCGQTRIAINVITIENLNTNRRAAEKRLF